jgi:ectoine hydroxylase-related dioxygenase (phytanoyl-CoA dioxygenase family)
MNYCAGFIRQQENQQLGIPVEMVQRMPRRLQELVGYGIYNGLIGHIDKQSPASVLLKPESAGNQMIWDQVG